MGNYGTYLHNYVYTVYWVLNVTIKDCDFPNEYIQHCGQKNTCAEWYTEMLIGTL